MKIEKRIIFDDEIIGKSDRVEIFYDGERTTIYNFRDIDPLIIKNAITRFEKHFETLPVRDTNIGWIWCLVANVIDEHEFGEQHEIRHGTKQFVPGTKVYVLPGGFARDKVIVIGRARKQRRLIKIWMRSNYITNWRIKKVYDPFVINEMLNGFGWDETDESKMRIISILKFLKPDYVFDENDTNEKE